MTTYPRLGGMALANGLLVHGPRHWAAAVRGPDGEVTVRSGTKPRLVVGPLGAVPLVRGALRLGEAIAVLPAVRMGTPHARFAMERPAAGVGVVLSMAASALARRHLRSPLAQETVAAVGGLLPAMLSLRGSQAAMWHAVEHKSIAAYEEGGPGGLRHAADHPKEHERCGSNLVLPLIATSTVANVLLRRLPVRPGTGARAAAAGIGAGAAVELMGFTLRHPEHPVSRLVAATGHFIQARFVTREPSADAMVVGRRALEELFAAEGIAHDPPGAP